jgi:small conductance mechanosensitive channel
MGLQSAIDLLSAELCMYLSRLASAAAILLLGLGAAYFARKIVDRLFRRADLSAAIFFSKMTFISVLVVGFLLAPGVLGLHIAALATLMGALGLAFSLSLQDVAKNVVAGLYLLMERLFQLGDQITVRTFTGHVKMIGLRTTMLATEDGQQVIMPNTIVLSEVVLKHPIEKTKT